MSEVCIFMFFSRFSSKNSFLVGFLVILSVAFGIWVGLFFGAFQWGTFVQKMDDIVNRELGHIQIHHPEFVDEEYDYNFPNGLKPPNTLMGHF